MKRILTTTVLLLVTSSVLAEGPYAGMQDRTVKALSEQQVAESLYRGDERLNREGISAQNESARRLHGSRRDININRLVYFEEFATAAEAEKQIPTG